MTKSVPMNDINVILDTFPMDTIPLASHQIPQPNTTTAQNHITVTTCQIHFCICTDGVLFLVEWLSQDNKS